MTRTRGVLLGVVAVGAVVFGQRVAWAQVAGPDQQVVIGMGTALTLGAVLAIGTLITSIVGPYIILKIHVATIEERCKAICHTLDRHEEQIQKLNDRES